MRRKSICKTGKDGEFFRNSPSFVEVVCVEAFTMEIAGLCVRVQPLFQSTREYCKLFLTDKSPDFFVEVTVEDLAFQQKLLEQEAIEEGIKIRKFTEPFLERATIQRKVAEQLSSRNTCMLHGSAVSVDGNAYLFTAPCKTGKSTHTRLWREVFGQRAIMINDDMPILQITSSQILVFGSPWCGKHGLGANICVPLKGICFLHRGTENRIHSIAPESGIPMLCRQMYAPAGRSLVDMLAERVPLWEMYCNKEPEAAQVSYSAMHCEHR